MGDGQGAARCNARLLLWKELSEPPKDSAFSVQQPVSRCRECSKLEMAQRAACFIRFLNRVSRKDPRSPAVQSHTNQEQITVTTITSASTTATASSTSVHYGRAFWEHLWRTAGIQYVVFFVITSVIYGYQPQVGASAAALDAFYNGDRTRILVAAFFSGLNLLNLMWFAAALRTTLAEVGQDGWGTAATAASAAFGAVSILLTSLSA